MSDSPDLSVVVTLLNEEGSVEELYRRTVTALDGRPFELILVDDGSTDGTWAAVERLHAADPRVRAVRFKRNFGQHPAMHAGLSRARGEIVVTMDGDLQNQPEDIPRLVAAVEAGADVASGRRAARNDSWGRTLPSRLINGMLRRFTGVSISDFGCAFNAYRRSAVEPMLPAIGKQKFTKALDPLRRRLGRRGRRRPRGPRGQLALLAAAADPARAARARRLLAAADPVDRGRARRRLHAARDRRSGSTASGTGSTARDFPGPLLGGVAVLFVLGIQGFILALVGEYLGRIQREVEGRPLYTIDGGALSEARSGHRRGGVHLVELHPPPAGAHGARRRLARRAHLRRQPREPRGRDEPRAALVRPRRHPRPGARREARRRGGRDRERRRRVARREVDRGGRVRVRHDERRGDADPARRDPAHARSSASS